MAGTKTLTAANSIIMLSVPRLFDTPQQLQGFMTDDIFDNDSLSPAETQMGVDGLLSAGWVPIPVVVGFSLQADSDSIAFFETIYQASQTAREIFYINGNISLPSLQRKYNMRRGILTGYPVIPTGKKVMQGRKFQVTFESVTGAPY